jgi:hypothetical protein
MPSENTKKLMPPVTQHFNQENLRDFFVYMKDRQDVWYNRFVLELPQKKWTKNPILKEYKFTNVYRQLDRNTNWLIENCLDLETKEATTKQKRNEFWKIVVFRYFNKPELFEYMGGIPDLNDYEFEAFNKKVLKYKKKFGRVFHSAYMVNPPKQEEDKKLGLELFYCKHVMTFRKNFNLIFDKMQRAKTAEEVNSLFSKNLDCVAGFLAYEIYCDLTYTSWFKFKDNDFVNVGPGAYFGLRLIFPSLERNMKKKVYKLDYLRRNSDKFFKLYGLKFRYWAKQKLGMRCIEHSLCEYSKYWRMKLDVGKPRQKFIPISKNNLYENLFKE